MNKINYNRVFRIAVGSTLSYFLCTLIGLKYSASAAVITLLSTQDTKNETILDVIKRILSYLYAILSAYILFRFIGYNALAFAIFMALLVAISYLLNWQNTLSSSTVVTTHFLLEKTFAPRFVANELMLIAIGTAAALLLNKVYVDNRKQAQRDCEYIEQDISDFLRKIVEYIKGEEEYDKDWLELIFQKTNSCHEKAISSAYNMEETSNHYYIEYFEMRREQCRALGRMCNIIDRYNSHKLPMTDELCTLLYRISSNIHTKSSYKNDIVYINELSRRFDSLPLPDTREKLNGYNCTYEILLELTYFLELNYKFVNQLSNSELNIYW